MSGTRKDIYYWKCDRPAALHGVERKEADAAGSDILPALTRLLTGHFPDLGSLKPAGGKGDHRTYFLDYSGGRAFVRVEDGPEQDGHLAMESQVMTEVAKTGVPVPRVLFTDASRTQVPFAVQVIEYFDCPDLNALHRDGSLQLEHIVGEIGRGIIRWQDVPASGFGPFDSEATTNTGRLTAYHETYPQYFRLHLERHLTLLVTSEFLTPSEAADINRVIDEHSALLDLSQSCLVHKDVALWNIMGSSPVCSRATSPRRSPWPETTWLRRWPWLFCGASPNSQTCKRPARPACGCFTPNTTCARRNVSRSDWPCWSAHGS
ncbi:MAG: aminoglycoside phosphotransferase family protein [Opitutaceae bacterium]|jgi:hypothetical protein